MTLPSWAIRIRAEREARGWSQRDAIRNLRAHSPVRQDGRQEELPSDESLLRQWKGWERGEHKPDFYAPLIAKTFGTVTHAIFPAASARDLNGELLSATGLDTLELVSKIRSSSVDTSTLDALRITADSLCSEYPYMPAAQLRLEGQQWLRRIIGLLDSRMTLSQHQDVLSLAGLVALLVGCVEYDMGDRSAAEGARRSALALGAEADDHDVIGWAHEMTCWFALTQGNYRGVIAAGDEGIASAGHRSVGVQLIAQQAKAWARMGDRRQVEVALDRGRTLLESLPYPTNLDNHFVVDPAKFDFYAMDCYRQVGEDRLAYTYANEVLRAGTNADGTERSPMRNAEARITLAIAAARSGDLERAVSQGRAALGSQRRQSLPSLVMVGHELGGELSRHFPREPMANEYLDELTALGQGPAAASL